MYKLIHNRLKIISPIFFKIFIILLFYILACKNASSPSSARFFGNVKLEGNSNHEGIKISLYRVIEPDSTWLNLSAQYKQIGIVPEQYLIFDHREHIPDYTTYTDVYGDWEITDVEPGNYNVVAEKDSFGWVYSYNKSGGEIIFPDLKRAMYLSGIIEDDIILDDNQFIYIIGETYLPSDKNLRLADNNVVVLFPNAKLNIMGTITKMNQNYTIVTSDDLTKPGSGILIDNGNTNYDIHYFKFNNLRNALYIKAGSQVNVRNSHFENGTNGIVFHGMSLNVANCVFSKFEQYSIEAASHYTIEKSFFINKATIFLNISEGVVSENVIAKNNIGLIPLDNDSNAVIRNNEIRNNDLAIAVNSSKCTITKNNFYNNNIDIEMNLNYVHQSFNYSDPKVLSNNFENSNIAVTIYGTHSLSGDAYKGVGIIKDLIFNYCYWGSDNPVEIEQKIIDAKDYLNYKYYILYTPYLDSRINDSGIN